MFFAAVLSLAVGLLQFFILLLAIAAVMRKSYIRAAVLALIKTAVYITAVLILVKLFRAMLAAAAIGFGAGFFLCVFIYFIYTLKKKSK